MQSFKGGQAGPVVCKAVTVNVDPPNLAANVGAFLNVAMPAGTCRTGQRVVVNPLADIADAGYFVGGARISATDTVRVQCINVTVGAINPAALDYSFVFLGSRSGA